jgi:hypothetical protein
VIGVRAMLVVAALASSAAAQPMQPMQPMQPAPYVYPPPPLGKSGILGGGLSIEPLDLGSIQAITSHGWARGLDVGVLAQIDLGTRWALRLPIELGAGSFGHGAGYAELAVIPGALYRWRNHADQALVPYVGGGLRFGFVGIGKSLVGQPLLSACCHDWGDGDGWGGGGHSDPNTENTSVTEGGLSFEIWGGYEWHPSRWFSIHLAGAIGYEHLLETTVIVLRETLGVRVSI